MTLAVLKLYEKHDVRMLNEIVVFETIIQHFNVDPITVELLVEKTGYPYLRVKKVIYTLGEGRDIKSRGRQLIRFIDSVRTPGRQKIIILTAKGKRLMKKLEKLR